MIYTLFLKIDGTTKQQEPKGIFPCPLMTWRVDKQTWGIHIREGREAVAMHVLKDRIDEDLRQDWREGEREGALIWKEQRKKILKIEI